MSFDERDAVVPDGGAIRRLRREQGWSRREFLFAIARASERATGVPTTLSLSVLKGIEETNEPVAYGVVCRVAGGLDCEPLELVQPTESAPVR